MIFAAKTLVLYLFWNSNYRRIVESQHAEFQYMLLKYTLLTDKFIAQESYFVNTVTEADKIKGMSIPQDSSVNYMGCLKSFRKSIAS